MRRKVSEKERKSEEKVHRHSHVKILYSLCTWLCVYLSVRIWSPCISICVCVICECVPVCVTPRHRALSATRGPCCWLLAYPRILLGASHTWVAHSSWALHIQIAVMNIIREKHRGDVQGTHTHTNSKSYVSAQTHMSAHTHTQRLYVRVYMHIWADVQITHAGVHPFHTLTLWLWVSLSF